MPPVIPAMHPTFGAGEISPSLLARVDVAKYHAGLRTARNINIMPQGGGRNRPGTGYVATAKDSTHSVRTVRFSASTETSYVLEFGHQYLRVYTVGSSGAQQSISAPTAWSNATAYVVGDLASRLGVNYYCILAHTNQQPPNATYWYPLTGAIYEIPTPYAGTDLFKLKFAQSADVLYIAGGPTYAPRTLTYFSATDWVMALYANKNGPFMLQNTDTTITITPSATSGSGITLSASQSIFQSTHVGALFQLKYTINGQTTTPQLTSAAQNWINTGTGATSWQAIITGTWTGTILLQTSPDNITWTTVQTITSNNTYTGDTGFSTYGFFRAIMQSGLAFSGSASVALTGKGTSVGPTTISALNAATANAVAGDTVLITLTSLSGTGDTVKLQRSDDGGATWTDLATYTTNQAATSVATTKTTCLCRAIKTIDGGGSPAATVDGTTGAAPTKSYTISTASVSQAIQCGPSWSFITNGTWTGKVRVEISTDGGNNWGLVHSFQSANSGNENTNGPTGVRQCLLRVSTDPNTTWSGTATVDLSSTTFDWVGVVKIASYSSGTSVTADVQNLSNTNSTGLANTSATWQWSEGSWSDYRGYPHCVSFFQDRLAWASTEGEQNTVWMTEIGTYDSFYVDSPITDADGLSVVLPGRQLNSVQSMTQMLNVLIALTSDAEYAVGPGLGQGPITPTSVDQSCQGHRGSALIDPVIVGSEIILIQQMGTRVRNLIFQLAVNGYFGDDISYLAQHLLTGYSIVEMAYQQEPDSIIWFVRSDGQLLSTTYIKEQEMNAWTHHDTNGLFESVCVVPNPALGINEVWLVVNRNGTRMIEVLKPRDQGTAPKDQWFVDCGKKVTGSAMATVSGLDHLNGYTVSVNADGNVQTQKVVASGQITLDVAADQVIVGLPYVSDLETLPLEIAPQGASSQGSRSSIPRAVFRVLNTRGLYVRAVNQEDSIPSTGTTGFYPVIWRTASMDMDTAIPLQTTDKLENIGGGYNKQMRIFVRQVDPMPFTMLGIFPEVVLSGR